MGPKKEAEAAPPALGKEATPPPPREGLRVHFGFLSHSQSGRGFPAAPPGCRVPRTGHWGAGQVAASPREGVRGLTLGSGGFPRRKPLLPASQGGDVSRQAPLEPAFDSVTQQGQ